jgi:ribose transport system substrate-binding protein
MDSNKKVNARGWITWLITLVMISAFLVGCVATTPASPAVNVKPPTNAELQKGKPIVFISPNRAHPVVKTMSLGFWEACKDLGVTCKDLSWDGVDMSNMAVSVDQAIAQGVSGAIPFVDKAVYDQDAKMIKAGIPSIAIHVNVKQGDVPGLLGWVATDQADYAKRAADAIGEKIGGKGTVALTQGSLNDVENLVSTSFVAEMKAKYPAVTVLEPQMEGFDAPAAIAVAEAIIQAHPGIVAAFGTTGGSPTTWAKAAEAQGLKPGQIVIIGMDYTRPNLDLVKSGQVYALVGQPLYEETYRAVELLVQHLQGKEVPYNNPYPAPIIMKADIDKYYGYADRVDKLVKSQ